MAHFLLLEGILRQREEYPLKYTVREEENTLVHKVKERTVYVLFLRAGSMPSIFSGGEEAIRDAFGLLLSQRVCGIHGKKGATNGQETEAQTETERILKMELAAYENGDPRPEQPEDDTTPVGDPPVETPEKQEEPVASSMEAFEDETRALRKALRSVNALPRDLKLRVFDFMARDVLR